MNGGEVTTQKTAVQMESFRFWNIWPWILCYFICFQDGWKALWYYVGTQALEKRLTIHIQAVVSDPLLPSQRRVERLTAQRCSVVFPFHREPDGAGHTERFPVVLLGHHTWGETGEMRWWKGREQVGWGEEKKQKQFSSQIMLAFSFSLLRYHRRGKEKGK